MLLYVNHFARLVLQAVSDVERNWIHCTEEQVSHLSALQQRGSKKEVQKSNSQVNFIFSAVFANFKIFQSRIMYRHIPRVIERVNRPYCTSLP
jgi:hypothetical protein